MNERFSRSSIPGFIGELSQYRNQHSVREHKPLNERLSDSTIALIELYRLAADAPRLALERMAETDKAFFEDFHYKAFRPGILINAGSALEDPSLIQEGTSSLASILASNDPLLTNWRRSLFYNLGNGYSALSTIKRDNRAYPDDPLLQQTKEAYRKAIEATEENFDQHLLAEVYTNYGNALSACGRHYEALLAYDHALAMEPTHSMALGNKGIELERYAFLARNQSGLLLAEAYELCRAGAQDETLDNRGLGAARSVFANHRDFLEPVYAEWRDRLNKVRRRGAKDSSRSREEEHHHHFAVKHDLYLNLCVHSWPCPEQHSDSLFFEYVAPLDDPHVFDQLARYFNQAKEDYATARYLLAEAQRQTPRRQRISDRTRYADLLEYADYGLTGGLAKAAYASAYNILDKIAVFLKWELGLPEDETNTSFRRIWHSDRRTVTLRTEVQKKNDPNLYALYDIALELGQPAFKHLSDLRHAITHRHLVVHEWVSMIGERSSREDHILLDDLCDSAITMLRLVKAALVYLASYLSQEHDRRMAAAEGVIAPLFFYWQHEVT